MILDSFSFDSVTPVSPTTTNLVAWYALENVNDSHTGGYTLTNNGTVTFGAGKNSNAATFDGTNSLSRDDEAGISITGAQTWACWIKPDAFTVTHMSKWLGTGDQRSILFDLQADGTVRVIVSGSGGGGNTTTATILPVVTGVWTHVAFSYAPSTSVQIYINGFLKATNTTSIPASIFDGSSRLELGGANAAASFDGQIDDACIFNKTLSLAEIKWLVSNTFGDL